MSILEPIYKHDRKRIAAGAGDTPITYGRLCDDIDSMAHWLLGNGLEPGERVTLHIEDTGNPDYWDWILHLGVIRAGLVHSTGPMPPPLAASGAIGSYRAAIGVLDKLKPQANPAKKLAFNPRGEAPLAEQIDIPDTSHDLAGLEKHCARLLSTSGTTGQPKVIRWDADMIEARLKQVRDTGDITPDTTLLTLLGFPTTTGLRYPLAAWQLGASAILMAIGDKRTDLVGGANASTFFATSPFRMQEFLRRAKGEWNDKDKRVIELFGGRVPPKLRDFLLENCCKELRMSYGATEVGRVAAGDTALVDRHAGAVGMVEPGITVEIIDRKGQPVPAGKVGIVRLKSDFMCDSYVEIPGKKHQRTSFRGGWFYPGDFGILYEDGLFAITGRISETINLAGAKVSPQALEARIGSLPEINDVFVTSMPNEQRDMLVIVVKCDDGTDLEALRPKIRKLLPSRFPFLLIGTDGIPRNAMGRIQRRALTKALAVKLKQAQEAKAKEGESVN